MPSEIRGLFRGMIWNLVLRGSIDSDDVVFIWPNIMGAALDAHHSPFMNHMPIGLGAVLENKMMRILT